MRFLNERRGIIRQMKLDGGTSPALEHVLYAEAEGGLSLEGP